MTQLGSTSSPWQVTATLIKGTGSDSRATLVGAVTVNFVNGWANFSTLAISHSGSGYTIDLTITRPADASKYTKLTTASLTVSTRQLMAVVSAMPNGAVINTPFSLSVEIRDKDTNQRANDIAWKVCVIYCEMYLWSQE